MPKEMRKCGISNFVLVRQKWESGTALTPSSSWGKGRAGVSAGPAFPGPHLSCLPCTHQLWAHRISVLPKLPQRKQHYSMACTWLQQWSECSSTPFPGHLCPVLMGKKWSGNGMHPWASALSRVWGASCRNEGLLSSQRKGSSRSRELWGGKKEG